MAETGATDRLAGRVELAESLRRRVVTLESLVRAIEDELSDESLDDELKLQHIGERVGGAEI